MGIIVQSDSGSVVGANAYDSYANFIAYHTNHGNTFAQSQAVVETALIKATSYMDMRFDWVGLKLNQRAQSTGWPRQSAYDEDSNLVVGVPQEIKNALYEYANIVLSTITGLTPAYQTDPTGRIVQSTEIEAGPVKTKTEYAVNPFMGSLDLPPFPQIDRIISHLVINISKSTNWISRA